MTMRTIRPGREIVTGDAPVWMDVLA